MATIKRRIVLFADLRGSTSLYQTLGNAPATSVVTQTITAMARRVPESGGQLVKTLGDGLMAVFPSAKAAVQSAMLMQEELQHLDFSSMGKEGTPTAPVLISEHPTGQTSLQLQVAITAGEVVEVGGDCFGDAVNVAARLLDHAGDNETLVTADVLAELPWDLRSQFRNLDKVHLRGRFDPVHVHLLAPKGSDTAATELESQLDPGQAQGLQLVWQGRSHTYERSQLPLLIGRGAQSMLRVEEARVSRVHARVDVMGGALQLTDLSINGTYVRFAGDDEVLSLRRGACTLHGSGEIGLGGTPHDITIPVLTFTVLNTVETRPIGLF